MLKDDPVDPHNLIDGADDRDNEHTGYVADPQRTRDAGGHRSVLRSPINSPNP